MAHDDTQDSDHKVGYDKNAECDENVTAMDSADRIKLIGTISDLDTPTLLQAYIEILGIESLRPLMLASFLKHIRSASSATTTTTTATTTAKKKKKSAASDMPVKNTRGRLEPIGNKLNKPIAVSTASSSKCNSSSNSNTHHPKRTNKNGRNRNFASHARHTHTHHKSGNSGVKHSHSPNLKSVLLHSTNQPLPSRTTPAPLPNVDATIHIGDTVNNHNHQLSSHNHHHTHNQQQLHLTVTNGNGHCPQPQPQPHSKHTSKRTATATATATDDTVDTVNSVDDMKAMSLPLNAEQRMRKCKYFDVSSYPHDMHLFSCGELPDDIYMKIFSWLDGRTVLCALALVSRAWFNIASQASSVRHIKLRLPLAVVTLDNIEWRTLQGVHKLEIVWRTEPRYDAWSAYRECLLRCCQSAVCRMRDVHQLSAPFHESCRPPLLRFLTQQRHLVALELNAIDHWKPHDIEHCITLLMSSGVADTVQSFIVHNFVMIPSTQELLQLTTQQQHQQPQQQLSSTAPIVIAHSNAHDVDLMSSAWNQYHSLQSMMDMLHSAGDLVLMKSAKILGEFLIHCHARLHTFRWHLGQSSNLKHTCYGIYVAFIGVYFKYLQEQQIEFGGIRDLQLPSFPALYRQKEVLLYRHIVQRFRLTRFQFCGDLSVVDWKTLGATSDELSQLYVAPTRSPNESFTHCFTQCGQKLRYLCIDTEGVASAGYFQNDEVTDFITPYFRAKALHNLQRMHINVKYLEEHSMYTFLSKCKSASSLKHLSINAQSLKMMNGSLRNDDLRKYVAQFVGSQQITFTISVQSQFYSARRVLLITRLPNNDGIDIDKTQWKKQNKIDDSS
mmetsp:Transcript_41365/g.68067  ORF Transcript_41365/g.68067 Transcript_41365/m.68067 type:complete len:838 (-) Transcript_41365:112-2625(-)